MAGPVVVVTYPLDAEMEAVNREVLDGDTELVFSSRLPDEGPGREALERAEVFVSWNIGRELDPKTLDRAHDLRLIQTMSAGVDHVDFARIPERVVVAGNVGAYAEPMAEHVIAMVLACAKRLRQRHAALARGDFDQQFSISLDGAVCLVVGFGGIGKATARLMRAFGAQIWALNTSGRTEEPVAFSGTLSDLDTVIGGADVVVLSLPLTSATRGLISDHELGLMKPTAILVNVARGDVIDQRALYEHLERNPNFYAGIDTWWCEPLHQGKFETDYPFLELANVVGSPHNSALVPEVLPRAARRAAENVRRFVLGEPLTGVVKREEYVKGT